MSKYYLTKARLEELKQELQEFKAVKRIEIAERLKAAKEYGDLSENSEYTEARNEQERVEKRILELEEILKSAVVIRKTEGATKVQIGSTVTFKDESGKMFEYQIVGSNETRPEEGKISNESPLGRALLGHKVGESIRLRSPQGERVYQITKIE